MSTRSFWIFIVSTLFVCGRGDGLATSHFINFLPIGFSFRLEDDGLVRLFSFAEYSSLGRRGPDRQQDTHRPPFLSIPSVICLFCDTEACLPSIVFALLFGFTHLITAPLTPMLIGRLYGFKQIGLLTGVVNTVHFLGGGLFTYATGLIFDWTGGYRVAFTVAAVMAAIAVLCGSFIREKSYLEESLPRETTARS